MKFVACLCAVAAVGGSPAHLELFGLLQSKDRGRLDVLQKSANNSTLQDDAADSTSIKEVNTFDKTEFPTSVGAGATIQAGRTSMTVGFMDKEVHEMCAGQNASGPGCGELKVAPIKSSHRRKLSWCAKKKLNGAACQKKWKGRWKKRWCKKKKVKGVTCRKKWRGRWKKRWCNKKKLNGATCRKKWRGRWKKRWCKKKKLKGATCRKTWRDRSKRRWCKKKKLNGAVCYKKWKGRWKKPWCRRNHFYTGATCNKALGWRRKKWCKKKNKNGATRNPPDFSVKHTQGACNGKYLGDKSGKTADLSACKAACGAASSCAFLSFCPSGSSCRGGNANKCALYSSCTSSATQYSGYTTYTKKTQLVTPATTTTTKGATCRKAWKRRTKKWCRKNNKKGDSCSRKWRRHWKKRWCAKKKLNGAACQKKWKGRWKQRWCKKKKVKGATCRKKWRGRSKKRPPRLPPSQFNVVPDGCKGFKNVKEDCTNKDFFILKKNTKGFVAPTFKPDVYWSDDLWATKKVQESDWKGTCVAYVATGGGTCKTFCKSNGMKCVRAMDDAHHQTAGLSKWLKAGGYQPTDCTLLPSLHSRQSQKENGCNQKWGTQMCACN